MRISRPNRKVTFLLFAIVAAIILTIILTKQVNAPTTVNNAETSPSDSSKSTPEFNKQKYSIDDPASLWVVVNKKRPLPSNYVPAGMTSVGGVSLRPEASQAMVDLQKSAAAAGYSVGALSGYRSFAEQTSTYNGFVSQDGTADADRYSARPGHSEHQTGLAVDLGTGECDLEACFGNTPTGKWLAQNAYKYGFIIRYPEGKESITGYQYEPWHLRYVGKELAEQLQKTGQTMEQFFGLPMAPTY